MPSLLRIPWISWGWTPAEGLGQILAQPKQNSKNNIYYAEQFFRIQNSAQAILCQRVYWTM